MKRRHLLIAGGATATAACITHGCQWNQQPSPMSKTEPLIVNSAGSSFQAAMGELVTAFLQALTPDQQSQVVFPFDSQERLNWHYIPRSRQGIAFKAMSAEQRQACDRLLQFTLSETGYRKLQNILTLETVLRQLGGSPSIRDPELYYLTVFGNPANTPWGWRLEGHHLSLNLAVMSDELVTVTPSFWGANPAKVDRSPHQGLQTLPQEQDLAFELLATLTPAQQQQVLLANQSFGDILMGPGRAAAVEQPAGLLLAEMTESSRNVAMRLLETYVGNLAPDLVAAQWQQVQKAGLPQIRFAWAGALQPQQAHYYRLHGPTVLIEYDNTQNNANHIHTVWRDLVNDFGGDILRAHHEHMRHG